MEERDALTADRSRRLKQAEEQEAEGAATNDAVNAQEILQDIEDFEFIEGKKDSIYFQKTFPDPNAQEDDTS